MIFSIVNPSDPYTMDADNLMIAACAIALLGHGSFGLRQIDGEGDAVVPPFPFGGHETFFIKKFDRTFEQTLEYVDTNHLLGLVSALGSVLIGDLDDRRAAMQAMRDLPEKERQAWLLKWHDKKRSSVTDIGRAAWQISNALSVKMMQRGVSPVSH